MILNFKDYQSAPIDFEAIGQINESNMYFDQICSVMDKLTFYVKRNLALENSSLNESAKRAYKKDIRLNRDERIAAACIFNEMLRQYEENMQEELSAYDEIIKKGEVLEEGVEYDINEILSINELKIFHKLKNVSKTIIDGAKDLTVKTVDVVKAKKEDLISWAKQAKKEFDEKYTALKELIDNIVKKGIDTIEKFINKILDVFTSIGDNLVDAVKKLGGLKMDKGETAAKIDIEDADGIYAGTESEEEKSFINNIILRVEAILNKDKENAAKLMTESYVTESVVDNKFIAWLAGYKEDGTKMNWWKCMLIGICASLIVWLLPKVLVLAGLGGALAAFIAALVGVVWNGLGMLKLIYRRNKERKEGEKFFDRKTSIFFALSLIANIFSVATFIKTIGPLMREICNTMGWTGGDDMSKFGEYIYNLTKKISPKTAFKEGGFNEISEEIKNYGGDVRGNDLAKSAEDALKTMKDMPGASEENIKAFEEFLNAAKDAKGTSAVYTAWEQFQNNADLPYTAVFDTSKWGGTGPIRQAIEQLKDVLPESALLGTVGSEATQKASEGMYGFATYLTGVNQEQANMIFQKAAEIAGKDMSTLELHEYGLGAIANIITTTTKIDGMFDMLAPNVPFLPMVMPFFDKKKWGEYKMRFASATRGSAAYIVDHVDMITNDDAKKIEDSKALDILTQLHDRAWEEYKRLHTKEVNEGLFSKKKDDKEKDVEEPQYIVFYIKADEETGHDMDKLNDKNEGSESEEDNEDDKKKEDKEGKEDEVAIGVIIDTLTMMCADVCNFNESVHVRKRPQPYFMKGLLSRLSFRPTKDNDNDTKEYIRETLGQTMKTLATQCVLYGNGSKYIDSTVDGKKAQYALRSTVLGNDKKKVNPDKQLFELGNFSPKELLDCVSDKSDNNKVAYDFLDGSFASKITIKKEGDTIKSASAVRDASTIENVKYYRVSKDSYKKVMNDWEKQVAKWEKDGKLGKKPAKPSYVKGDDKEYYKRASKKWLSDPANKRKKLFDFVDIRIVPLLKKGELYKKLTEKDEFKKVLYKETDGGDVKINKEVISVLKPFLYRPEKTFAKDDEYQLSQQLKDLGVEGEKLGWFKHLFKDEKQLHDTFKDIVELIWDYLQDNRRKVYKGKDFKPNHNTTNEDVEYSVFDELIEEFFNDDYSEECEYEYDLIIEQYDDSRVLTYDDFLWENYE